MNGEEEVVVTRDVKVKSKPRALRTTFIIDTPPKRNNYYTPMKTGYVATRNINDEDMKFLTTNQVKKLDEGVNNVQPKQFQDKS